MRLSRTDTLRRIVWPAALPEIFAGLRIGFSLTLIGTILGEMFGSQRGLGYLLINAIGLHNIPTIMAVTLLLVLFAASVSVWLLAWNRRLRRGAAA
jgi:NitT/TauT family transport system permease protein